MGKIMYNGIEYAGTKSINASEVSDGFMSKEDKTKLNGIESGAQANVIATDTTVGSVKPDGETITIDSDGTLHGAADASITADVSGLKNDLVKFSETEPTSEYTKFWVNQDDSEVIEILDRDDIAGIVNDNIEDGEINITTSNISDFPASMPASDVYDWAKASSKPTYTASEVGALPSDTEIPTSLSDLTDDTTHRLVTDSEKSTWNSKMDGDVTHLSGDISVSEKGAANGVAELDENGYILTSQLPSYVDNVDEYESIDNFPAEGRSDLIYVDKSTNKIYRWSGTTYIALNSSVALGETAQTAYRGDRGKIAYDHSQTEHAPADAQKNVQSDWNATSGDAFILNKPDSLPASDVYDWAKASSKPTYTASEVGALGATDTATNSDKLSNHTTDYFATADDLSRNGYGETSGGSNLWNEKCESGAIDTSTGENLDNYTETVDYISQRKFSMYGTEFTWNEGQQILVTQNDVYCYSSVLSIDANQGTGYLAYRGTVAWHKHYNGTTWVNDTNQYYKYSYGYGNTPVVKQWTSYSGWIAWYNYIESLNSCPYIDKPNYLRSVGYADAESETTYYGTITNGSLRIFFYDADKTYLGYKDITNKSDVSNTDSAYFRLCLIGYGATYTGGVSVNEGDTGNYEPYFASNKMLMTKIEQIETIEEIGDANTLEGKHASDFAESEHTHLVSEITDFPASMPASDVYDWAKSSSKPSYTASEVGAAETSHTHDASDISNLPTSLPANGGNADTVNNYTVNSDVPANAVFTDTWRPLGNTADTACAGNDSRLSDARTPTLHTHTKSQITDFPSSLPADGGNADTLDNKHADYFATATDLDRNGYGEHSGGSNMLNPTMQTKTENGITCTNNGDGTYTLNGTNSGALFYFELISNLKLNGTIKLLGSPTSSGISEFYMQVGGTKWSGADLGSGITDTYSNDTCFVRIYVGGGTTLNNAVFKPMLTKDLSATYNDYSPYFSSNKSLTDRIDRDFELERFGYVCPIINGVRNFKDSDNVIHRKIKRVCLADLYYYVSGAGNFYAEISGIVSYDYTKQASYISKYTYDATNSSIDKTYWNNLGYLYVRDTSFDGNITNFKNSLKDVYLYFVLSTEETYSAYDAGIVDDILNGTQTVGNADTLDGKHASDFSLTSHTHDDRYYTESEMNSLLANKTTGKLIGGQTASYHITVIALCQSSATSTAPINNWSSGKITFHRHNGLYSGPYFYYNAEDSYFDDNFNLNYFGSFSLDASFTKSNPSSGFKYRPCTFTYNDTRYGGVLLVTSAAQCDTVNFDGCGTFTPFGIDIYDWNTQTILNEEIYNSIEYDKAVLSDGFPVNWSGISGKPTEFTPASHTHNYLPLTGGTLTGPVSPVGKSSYIAYPSGGTLINTTGDLTGYLKITLPNSWTNTMLRFTVDIYNYGSRGSSEYCVGGYNYTPSSAWINIFAYSAGTSAYANLPIRFGHDGEKCAIYIGEETTVWSYPQVSVHDITVGFQQYDFDKWSSGWNVSVTTTLGTISDTITDPLSRQGVVSTLETVNDTITFGKSDAYGLRTNTNNYGRIGDSTNQFYEMYANRFYEDKVLLSNKYLGISAKAASATVADTAGTATTANNLSGFANYTTGSTASANDALTNGFWYISTSDTSKPQSSTLEDYRVFTTAYSNAWLQQIATDYRSNDIFTRNRNNGDWSNWRSIALSDDDLVRYSDILWEGSTRKLFTKRTNGAWDSQAYSKTGYTSGCVLSFKAVDTNGYKMIGLSYSPKDSASHTNLNYCWYLVSGGGLQIYESGSHIKSCGAYEAGTEFRIEYDGEYIQYYCNGSLYRAIAVSTKNTKLYFDSSWYNAGGIYDFEFKPSGIHSYSSNSLAVSTTFDPTNTNIDTCKLKVYDSYQVSGTPDTYGDVIEVNSISSHWKPQLWLGAGNGGRIRFRNKEYNTAAFGSWKTVAWTSEIPTSLPASDVYSWAKASTKPTYTASEVGAAASSHSHDVASVSSNGFMSADNVKNLGRASNLHYSKTANGGNYYKINITAETSWMLCFTIRIYQGYSYYDIAISGYNYGSNHWYSPSAILLGSTATDIPVYFGYDGSYKLWVAVPASSYTGLDIFNVTNGYTQVPNIASMFSISASDGIPTTLQTTIKAYRPLRVDEVSSWAKASSKPSYTPSEVGITMGTTDLTAGTSTLASGKVYIVYE